MNNKIKNPKTEVPETLEMNAYYRKEYGKRLCGSIN